MTARTKEMHHEKSWLGTEARVVVVVDGDDRSPYTPPE